MDTLKITTEDRTIRIPRTLYENSYLLQKAHRDAEIELVGSAGQRAHITHHSFPMRPNQPRNLRAVCHPIEEINWRFVAEWVFIAALWILFTIWDLFASGLAK